MRDFKGFLKVLGEVPVAEMQANLRESLQKQEGNPEYIEWLHPSNKLNLYELCVITCMHNDGLLVLEGDSDAKHLEVNMEALGLGPLREAYVKKEEHDSTEQELSSFEQELASLNVEDLLSTYE
tara:strand:+ start:422 stop:793 length:372 start_codon:yes stop_codon:yes gene_type:complete